MTFARVTLMVAACAGTALSAPAPPSDVNVELTPACDPSSKEPSSLVIAVSLPAGRRPVFRLDDEIMGTSGMSALITDTSAKDARGSLPLVRRIRDRALEFVPSRKTTGTVTFEYRARSISTGEDGPLEGLRHDATGIGGHGRFFLVLPESRGRYRMRVAWGTAQCPATVRGQGMSSFGRAAPADTVGELSSLCNGVYYWGSPQETKVDDGSLHLRSAWFGKPAFGVAVAGAWAGKLFAAERAFFNDDDPNPYSMFVRVVESHEDRANGMGQETSYLSWIGPRTTFARRLKVNIAHEMFHRWLGMRLRLRGPEGTAYWFTEGFTVHYSNVLAFRAGLLSVDEFLESLNDIATRHFDNKRAGATNDEIERGFFRDPALSIVPYTRGALYAAELDGELRAATRGKRTLDDALRELYLESRAAGARDGLPADAVRRRVQKELGSAGLVRYDAVIVRGGPPNPPADAYGPCFARRPRKPSGFEWVRVPGVDESKCRTW